MQKRPEVALDQALRCGGVAVERSGRCVYGRAYRGTEVASNQPLRRDRIGFGLPPRPCRGIGSLTRSLVVIARRCSGRPRLWRRTARRRPR
jgi:hypothetical protein